MKKLVFSIITILLATFGLFVFEQKQLFAQTNQFIGVELVKPMVSIDATNFITTSKKSLAAIGVEPMLTGIFFRPNQSIGVEPMRVNILTAIGVKPMNGVATIGVEPMKTLTQVGVEPMRTLASIGVEPMMPGVFYNNAEIGVEPMRILASVGVEPMKTLASIGVEPMYTGVFFSRDMPRIESRNERNTSSGYVNLFPNPTSGEFTINIQNTSELISVKVYNQLGALVRSERVISTSLKLDISNLQKRIYLVKVESNGEMIKSVKLLKEQEIQTFLMKRLS